MTPKLAFAALMALGACTHGPIFGNSAETVSRDRAPIGPPPLAEPARDGRCWAQEQTPAIYEQVMGEVQVVQAELAADGTVLRPPVYRKAPVPRIVRPRSQVTFEAPCPAQMTPDFIASLQRAMAARGYFAGNVTGTLDAPTAAAIRRYQSERGLNSAQLSLETARALGLAAVDLSPGGAG